MKLKIWDIDKAKDGISFQYDENFQFLQEEIKHLHAISPVKVEGTADKMAGLYRIKGNISAVLRLQCSRCLSDYDYDLEEGFEELFVPENVEGDWEEENVHPLESDEINITDMVKEIILINIPYIPLCSKDCKGLCPVCGTNLNEETCDCKVEKIDPRLADLAKWFDQNDQTE